MNTATVVLWRHAPTPANAAGQLQGQTDTQPGKDGLALGKIAAEKMLSLYGTPAAVYSSPLRRATATAALLGQPVIIEPGISQRSYGIWEGMSISEVAEAYPEQLAVRDAGGDPDIAGWETGESVGRRVAGAITTRTHEVLALTRNGLRGASDVESSHTVAAASENPGATGALEAATSAPVVVFASHGSAIATGLRNLFGLPESPQIFGYLHHANWVELSYHAGQWKVERYDFGVS